MNIKDIQQLIKFVAKSGVSEVKIESKDLKIGIKTSPRNKEFKYPSPSISSDLIFLLSLLSK